MADNEPVESEAATLVSAHLPNTPPYMEDLKREAAEEKAMLAEENIWSAAEDKSAPETRGLYRDYLRRVYFYGAARDGDSAAMIAWIRASLDRPRRYGDFPTMHAGPVPPGAAATYSGNVITIGATGWTMPVVSHEWRHRWDDYSGGLDGQVGDRAQVEPYAYRTMATEI